MSIKLTSSETGRNRSSVAAAVGTSNKISIAPATATHILNFPTAWSNVSVGAVDTTNARLIGGGAAQAVEITNIYVTDSNWTILDDTAISTSGGYLKLIGVGFQSGAVVYIQGTAATSTTYVSPTELRVVTPVLSSGTLQVYVVNPDNSVAIRLSGIVASGTPSWITTSPLAEQIANVEFSIQLVATSDTTVAYSLDNGSSLPSGVSLTTGGLLSGTVSTSTETTYSFTIIATDLEYQDTSKLFSVTITLGDIYLNVTPLLLKTNNYNWLTDNSTNKLVSTVGADAKPSAFSPFNRNWSAWFSAGNYLNVTGNNNLAFGTSDFTIECFINTTDVTTSSFIYDARSGANEFAPVLFMGAGAIYWYVNGVSRITSGTVVVNRWYHVVVSRVSGSTRMFLDGVQTGSTWVDSTNYISTRPLIGVNSAGSFWFYGFISNLRVLNGTGTTSPTVPTAPLTAIANTQLLTLESNSYKDNSNNNFTITKVGNSPIKSFGPFTETDLTTGSGNFDGTGDYVLVSNTTNLGIGTSDFTIEFWYYLNVAPAGSFNLMDQRSGSTSVAPYIIITSTQHAYGFGATNAIVASSAPVVASWTHLAVSRTSGVTKMFLNGRQIGSNYTDTNNYVNSRIYIGSRYDTTQVFNGYISNFRFVDGSSVYSANTTISSTPLEVVANTALLTLQNRMGENTYRFIDNSGHKHTLIRNGNITQTSFSPFSPNGWSTYFDGNGDYITVAANNTLQAIGTKDFTIECWINLTTIGGDIALAGDWKASPGRSWIWYITGSGTQLLFSWAAGTFHTANYTFQKDRWYHIAASRSGSILKMFVDGTEVSSNTLTNSIASTGTIYIGANNDSTSPTWLFNGYMSNLRLVIGTALYTANTTIQSNNLTAVTNTTILTFQSNRFIDNSTANNGSGFLLTPGGEVRAINYSPFRPTIAYDPELYGSSFYLDGSGDYLNATSNASLGFATSDWHIEFWVYPTSASNVRQDWIDINTSAGQRLLVYHNGTAITLFVNGAGVITANPLARYLWQWTHIAVSKVSGSTRLFINGQQSGVTYSDSLNYGAANPITIGKDSGGSTHVTGYMSDIILLKGKGLYTTSSSNIVPTSPLSLSNTVISNVASLLLTGRNSGMYDTTGRTTFEANNDVKVFNGISKFAGTSVYFDGNGDSLRLLANTVPALGTTDFTIEFWVYVVSFNSTNSAFIYEQRVAAGTVAPSITASSSNTVFINSGSVVITGSALTTNTWYHIAVARYSGNTKLFINGTQSGSTYLDTTNYVSQPILIGSSFNYGATNFLNGYIEDLRITKYARYSNNFPVPTNSFYTK
jgi:hypothetical protein